jgi:hypothetical protein
MGMSPAKLAIFKKHLKALNQRRKPLSRSANASQRNSILNLYTFPKVSMESRYTTPHKHLTATCCQQVFKPPADPPQDWDEYTVRNWLLSEGFDEDLTRTMIANEVNS